MAHRLSKEEIEKRLLKYHKDTVSIDYSTFTGMGRKARFFDKIYGECCPNPTCPKYGMSKRFGHDDECVLDAALKITF